MKRLFSLCVIPAVALCWAANAALAQATTYPQPYPRDGAVQLMENDRVIVWDVVWDKGRATTMHEHRYEQLSVTLVGGVVKVTSADGKTVVNSSRLGSINLVHKGTVHIEEGVSDVPQRKIMVEIKPVTGATSSGGAPAAFPRDGAVKLLENDQIAVWDYTWTTGRPVPRHVDIHDSVSVFLSDGTIRLNGPDGATRQAARKTNEVVFTPANPAAYSEESIAGTPRAIVIELK